MNPDSLPAAIGFSHAVVAAAGRVVYLAGQAGHTAAGEVAGEGMVEQFDQAAVNVAAAVKAAGGQPEHIVSIQIFVTSVDEYRRALKQIGESYRRHFGRHYPAMALLEVGGLFDPAAKVELVAVAVVPTTAPNEG